MLSGTKLEYTRRHNRRVIIETIRRNGPISRAEIAHITGLTTATISNLTSELLDENLLLETGRRKGQRGQPAIDLEMNPNGRFSLGLEIGRDQLTGVVINLAGQVFAEIREPWEHPAPEQALPVMIEKINQLFSQTNIASERFLGVGVAMPGPFLTREKTIVDPIDFPNWKHFPVVAKLSERIGTRVIVENDAMAAAIGEHFHGAGQAYPNFFYLFLGSGVGGALVLNGHPYQGFSPNAGEVGWMRHSAKGRRALIGQDLGLKPLYNFLKGYGLEVSRPQELESLFTQQHPRLWEWLNDAVDCLDEVFDAVNAIVGPEVIFLGGHFPIVILDYLVERLQIEAAASKASYPDKYSIYQAKLLRATAGELSSAIGAATLPIYESFSTQHALVHDDETEEWLVGRSTPNFMARSEALADQAVSAKA